MCNVNFVAEFNAFMRFAEDNMLSGRERLMWIALFHAANRRAAWNEQAQAYDWPADFFPVSNDALHSSACLDKRAVADVRNELKQAGLIDFQPGERNKRQPKYKLRYLTVGRNDDTNNTPNNAPNVRPTMHPTHDQQAPNDAPSSDPKEAPLYKSKRDIKYLQDVSEKHIDSAKKRLNINDDNWRFSERARMATAQIVVNAIASDARWGKDKGQIEHLFEAVMDAMTHFDLSPLVIYLMAVQSTTIARFNMRVAGVLE